VFPSRLQGVWVSSSKRVASNVLEAIGWTPLIRLQKVVPEGAGQVWGKAEFLNPAGSVKDRPALRMVEQAERDGLLVTGATIVEATSGNTGISLAMIAAVRGYRCVLVMPEDMSVERRLIMQAYGAEIEFTPAHLGMAGAVARAAQVLRDTSRAFMPSQFENAANPESHFETTAIELLEQCTPRIDFFVAGVGTGGTVTGVGRRLKEQNPQTRIVAVEPKGSAVLSGQAPGPHTLQGLGAGFVPDILDRSVIDEIVLVADQTATRMARRLAREEGLLVGPSAGANVHVASEVAAREPEACVVTILCDSGERYLV